ncbi:MAG: sulfotransferase [Myxococcota bacterium]
MSRPMPYAPQFVDAKRLKPFWMRALNGVGRIFASQHARFANADVWGKAAAKAAKSAAAPVAPAALSPSEDFREAFDRLTRAVDEEGELNWVGRIASLDDTTRMAATGLAAEAAYGRDPAIAETPIADPIFILGLPRTGTTALHHLLAADPRNRTIPYWESFDPVPPRADEPDRRAEKVEKMLKQLDSLVPEVQAIHPMTAELPEECVAFFMNNFRTLQFDIQYKIPSYVDWLLKQDARIAYRDYRRQLQLIAHARPLGKRFLLKDPTHLLHQDAIMDLFPDAKFIFIHRGPERSISSICSLYAYTRAIFLDEVDPAAIGQEIMAGYWADALDQSFEATRDRIAPENVIDVRQPDLVSDPLGVAAQIYRAFSLDFDEPARAGMEAHVADTKAAPRARHEHSLAGFGLRDEAVRERFKSYCERYAV